MIYFFLKVYFFTIKNKRMNEAIKLPKLDDYIAQKEREEFLVVRARITNETEKTIEIAIDDNPEAAGNIAERRLISDPKPEDGDKRDIRFPAGGMGIIIKTPEQSHLMAVLRASKSSFDRHLTSFTGLGHGSEINDPEKTAVRKGLEDLIIVVSGKTIIPKFNDNSFSRINIKAIIKDGAALHEETGKLPAEEARAIMLSLPNEKKFKISWRKDKHAYQGLPVYDPGTRGLDFIKIMAIELGEKIDKIKFLDGRIMGGRNPLNRDIYALELDEKFKWTGKISAGWSYNKNTDDYDHFIPNKELKFPQTPVLKTIIKELVDYGEKL